MTERELELRRTIFLAFARSGSPPDVSGEDPDVLEALERAHVIVRDDSGAIRMAHPFADHDEGATVESGGRTWRGNCAWDAFGIAAALHLTGYTVTGNGITADDTTLFHVTVPAERWWDDPAYT